MALSKVILFILLLFAVTPNLGFFSVSAVLLASLVLILLIYLDHDSRLLPQITKTVFAWVVLLIISYSGLYYGGLYQSLSSIQWGQLVFYLLIGYLIYCLITKQEISLTVVIVTYLGLSSLLIIKSPAPQVDSFYLLKEAPLKLEQGINPYYTTYTRVYSSIKPDYYHYLPFSFFLFWPFVKFFSDPRLTILAFQLLSVFLLKSFYFKNNFQGNLLLTLFLFLPRSFYILEHCYLDPIIFCFLIIYLIVFKRKPSWAALAMGLFFSLRHTLFINLPFFRFSCQRQLWRQIVMFLLPFSLVFVFLVINSQAFIHNILSNLTPETIDSPIQQSLNWPNFFVWLFKIQSPHYIYYLFAIIYLAGFLFIWRQKQWPFIKKLLVNQLFFQLCSYHSFFNHYYLVVLFFYLYWLTDFCKGNNYLTKKRESLLL
jgi:hypothetical protein